MDPSNISAPYLVRNNLANCVREITFIIPSLTHRTSAHARRCTTARGRHHQPIIGAGVATALLVHEPSRVAEPKLMSILRPIAKIGQKWTLFSADFALISSLPPGLSICHLH